MSSIRLNEFMLIRYKEAEKKKEPKELVLRRPEREKAVPKTPGTLGCFRSLCLNFSGVDQKDWDHKLEELVKAYGGAGIEISKGDFVKAHEPGIQMLLQPCQLLEEETQKCCQDTSLHKISRAKVPNQVQCKSDSQDEIDDEIVFDFAKKKQDFDRCARCCTEILQVYALCTQCLALLHAEKKQEAAEKKSAKKRKRGDAASAEEDTPEKLGDPSFYHCFYCATNDQTLCKGSVGRSDDTADTSKTHVYYIREGKGSDGEGPLACADGCGMTKGKEGAQQETCKQCQRCKYCSCGCHSTSWVMIYPEPGLSEIVGKVSKFFEEKVMRHAKSEEKWDEVSNKIPADDKALCKVLYKTLTDATKSHGGNQNSSYSID
jgi:hypothetical protein